MFKKIFLMAVICVNIIFASNLSLKSGEIVAHTEVFGDSTIDPKSTNIQVNLTKDDKIESLRGNISIDALSLVSDNQERDQHMYKVLNVDTYKQITMHITNITYGEDSYVITGLLTLNGVTKEIKAVSNIKDEDGMISLKGKFYIKVSDYGIEPPTLLFLTVRDAVDINFDLNLVSK